MRATIWTVLCLLPVCLASAEAREPEDNRVIVRHVSDLFEAEEFAELDRLAEKYRVEETRTGSGRWKLAMFYRGLSSVNPPCACDGATTAAFRDIESIEARYLRWIEQNPESAVARIAYASTLTDHAWLFRGSGLGATVAPEAWAPFRDHLAKARRYLRDHKQNTRNDPQWYFVMLIVAKGENWSLLAFQSLVDEAVTAHPYYHGIYYKAVDYLLPQWHGDPALIEEFANFAVEKTRDQAGAGMYARVYWYASWVHFKTGLFTDTRVVWDRMAAGIDDVLARYPDQWNINNFAYFSCLAKDRKKASELIARIEAPPIPSVWGYDDAAFGECQGWISL